MPSTVFWCARCAQLNASSFLWPGGAYLRATASAWRRSDVVATSTQLALQGRHGCEQGRVLDAVLLARLHHSNDEVLVGEEDACACVVSDASDARVPAIDACDARVLRWFVPTRASSTHL